MNAKQANSISIRNYLHSVGITPVSSNKRSSLYLALYRLETIPSLKVSHDQNLWVDFGNDNKGGTLIDLVLLLNPGYDVSDAIRAIENSTQLFFSFHQQNKKHKTNDTQHKTCVTSHKTCVTKHELALKYSGNTDNHNQENLKAKNGAINSYYLKDVGCNPAITDYLNQRSIYSATALPYCKEIYYQINGNKYFGLGNKNHKGWSIRNKYWKGCTAQGYSYYPNGSQLLHVFEGIFDLLSFIELGHSISTVSDFLVLNSLVNLKSAFSLFKNYKQVNLFLDHDVAGRKATKSIMERIPQCTDASSFYCLSKDLSEYHVRISKEHLLIKNQ